MIESAAQANDLPPGSFARVIWQESRFRPDVVGPMTRGGARALGIAQFMPATAAERGLLEPFNPIEALPKSGKFLAELRNEFGNLGLAAAAYNVIVRCLSDALKRRYQRFFAVTLKTTGDRTNSMGNPVQCGHRFQRKADSNPVIADSR